MAEPVADPLAIRVLLRYHEALVQAADDACRELFDRGVSGQEAEALLLGRLTWEGRSPEGEPEISDEA